MTLLKVKKSDGIWADVKQTFIKTDSGWQAVKGIFAKTQDYNWVPLSVTNSPIIFNVSPAMAPLTSTVTTINGSNFSDNMSVKIQTPVLTSIINGSQLTLVDRNTLRFNSPISYANVGTISVIDKFGVASPTVPYGFSADYTLYGLPTSTLPGTSTSFTFTVRSGFHYGNLVVTGPVGTSTIALDANGVASVVVALPFTGNKGGNFPYQVSFPDGFKYNFTINQASIYPAPTITAQFTTSWRERRGCGTISWNSTNANYVTVRGSSIYDGNKSTRSSFQDCGLGKTITLTAVGPGGQVSQTVTITSNK